MTNKEIAYLKILQKLRESRKITKGEYKSEIKWLRKYTTKGVV